MIYRHENVSLNIPKIKKGLVSAPLIVVRDEELNCSQSLALTHDELIALEICLWKSKSFDIELQQK